MELTFCGEFSCGERPPGKRAVGRCPKAELTGDLPGVAYFGGCASAPAAQPPRELVKRAQRRGRLEVADPREVPGHGLGHGKCVRGDLAVGLGVIPRRRHAERCTDEAVVDGGSPGHEPVKDLDASEYSRRGPPSGMLRLTISATRSHANPARPGP